MLIHRPRQFLANWRLKHRIKRTLVRHPDIVDFNFSHVIKNVKTRQVVACRANGENVAVKRFTDGSPDKTVESLVAELDMVAPRMSSGKNRVNLCRLALPEEGLVVLSFAQGKRFDDIVSKAPSDLRQHLMRRAGEWLAHYAEERREIFRWRPQRYIDGCAKSVSTNLSDEDIKLLAKLRAEMARYSLEAAGMQVTRAACHGDFTGLNLHVAGNILTGVDIQKKTRTVLARDIARFLVWAHLNYPEDTDWYGISNSDRLAFLSNGIISETEAKIVLPFFVADQLHRRLQGMHGDPIIAPRARQACRIWIQSAHS